MAKLHLGCGDVILAGWINIDAEGDLADVKLDLREPLPFENESVEYVFAEHFIEHISRNSALTLLTECARVLKPEGILRLTTPDLGRLVAAYIADDIDAWGDLWHPEDSCELLNQAFRYWGHQYVYDHSAMKKLLQAAGFKYAVAAPWGKSLHGALDGIESRPFNGEIIVEASITAMAMDYGKSIDLGPVKFGAALDMRMENAFKKILDDRAWAARANEEIDTLRKNVSYVRDLQRHIESIEKEVELRGREILRLQEVLHSASNSQK